MMEDKSKTADVLKNKESFFFQLRHLAGEVDTKVHFVKEQLVSKSCKLEPCQDQASANLFLMNTKKELSSAFEQVKVKYNDFNSCHNKFCRMQELVKTVLSVHEKRVEKMQDYMVCYGYVKPVMEPHKLISVKDVQSEPHSEEAESNKSESDDIDEDNDEESVSVSSSPQIKDIVEKQLIRTPKLEDLYGKLSENTLLLLKGVRNHSDDDLNTMQLPSYSISSVRNCTNSTQFDSKETEDKFEINFTSTNKGGTCSEPTAENSNNFKLDICADYKHRQMSTGADNSFQLVQSLSDMSEKYGNHLTSLRTPESLMKSKEQRKTPVFEDVYSMLSECTISLLRTTSHKSVSAENLCEKQLTSVLDASRNSTMLCEQNEILRLNDKSLSESNLQNCTQATFLSPKNSSKTSKTQSIKKPGPKEDSTYGYSDNTSYVTKLPKCARSLLYTQPPVSESTMRFTSSYRHMASSAGKENIPAVSMFDAMPESPKLLSRALIQDIYNNKY